MSLSDFTGCIGFIGAGNMAEAMARGLTGADFPSDRLIASDPAASRRTIFRSEIGVEAIESNAELVGRADVVILAVKPQSIADVLKGIAKRLTPKHLVISIAAGISTRYVEGMLGAKIRVVRAMPSTPMLVGKGMVALSGGKNATGGDLELARSIFSVAAKVLTVDESKMDAVTAVSGSGPAYFFYFIEALRDAGAREGLDEAEALVLATYTAEGAARMLIETDRGPEDLRSMVTSPNGTTQAAITAMESLHVKQNILRGVRAAANRSRELGK